MRQTYRIRKGKFALPQKSRREIEGIKPSYALGGLIEDVRTDDKTSEFEIGEIISMPAACRGHITDGVSPVESRSITPQGREAVALPFGQPRGPNPVVDIT